jgi:recombination protein RecA
MKEKPMTAPGISDISGFLTSLAKDFNKGEKIAWNLEDDLDCPTDVKEFISTGSTLLDYAISNRRDGGVPCGKLTEISGEEGSGKSLMACHILANTQKKGGIAVLIDTENALNPSFAKQVGVDLGTLLYLQPGTIESVFEAIEKCIGASRAKDVKVPVTIVWDSVAGTPPQAEIEGDYDPNSRIGVAAKAIAKGLRKLTDTVGKERVTLVFTNQLKYKMNVMGHADPWMTPGGKAIPYHASVRIRLESKMKLKEMKAASDGGESDIPKPDSPIIGIHTRAKCVKTRLGPPHRSTEFDIMFDIGIADEPSWREALWLGGEITKASGYMCMKDVDVTENGVVVKKPEMKFRAAKWKELLQDAAFRATVLSRMERLFTVRFDGKPKEEAEENEQ